MVQGKEFNYPWRCQHLFGETDLYAWSCQFLCNCITNIAIVPVSESYNLHSIRVYPQWMQRLTAKIRSTSRWRPRPATIPLRQLGKGWRIAICNLLVRPTSFPSPFPFALLVREWSAFYWLNFIGVGCTSASSGYMRSIDIKDSLVNSYNELNWRLPSNSAITHILIPSASKPPRSIKTSVTKS